MIWRLIPLFLPLLLSACLADKGRPKVVILKNPATLEFQSCTVADWGSRQGYDDNDRCVERWQEEGYVIWGSQ